MGIRQPIQHFVADRGKGETHAPLVHRISDAFNQSKVDKSIDQPDCAVMADLQTFGKFLNGYAVISVNGFDSQHGLVLLWRESGVGSGVLAEPEEFSERVPELGEHFIFGSGDTHGVKSLFWNGKDAAPRLRVDLYRITIYNFQYW